MWLTVAWLGQTGRGAGDIDSGLHNSLNDESQEIKRLNLKITPKRLRQVHLIWCLLPEKKKKIGIQMKLWGKQCSSLSTKWELTKHVHLQSPELYYFKSFWGMIKLTFPGGSQATTKVFIRWRCKGQRRQSHHWSKNWKGDMATETGVREGKGARPVVMTLKIEESDHEQKAIQEISRI